MVVMRIIRSAVLGTVLLASACGTVATADVSSRDESASASSPAVEQSDALVLRVDSIGGFVPPTFTYSRLPTVSIYADGRMITQGPQVTIYPAPALPNLLVRTLRQEGIERLIDEARRAGVGKRTDFGTPGVADATTTRFTLVDDGRTMTTEVYALGETRDEDTGLTAAQRQARQRMRDLLQTLTDSPAAGGPAGSDTRYEPTAMAAIVSEWAAGDVGTPPAPRAWRGPALPGQVVGPADVSCVTATGDALQNVLADAASANVETPWTYGGKRWSLSFRPLLPDETDCSSLGK